MANINVEIPKDLHKKIKVYCAVQEMTLKELVIVSLKNKVTRRGKHGKK